MASIYKFTIKLRNKFFSKNWKCKASLNESLLSIFLFLTKYQLFSNQIFTISLILLNNVWGTRVLDIILETPLHENCPNTEFSLVHIFLYLDRINLRIQLEYGKNTDQKKLRIWTLFTQWCFKYNIKHNTRGALKTQSNIYDVAFWEKE